MNIDNKLDLLGQIKEVDAPPFLFTRIKQQVYNLGNTDAPVKWKWAFAFTSIVILLLNISIFIRSAATDTRTTDIENVINGLNLSTTNDIYHE